MLLSFNYKCIVLPEREYPFSKQNCLSSLPILFQLHCDRTPGFDEPTPNKLNVSSDSFRSKILNRFGTAKDIEWRDPIVVNNTNLDNCAQRYD